MGQIKQDQLAKEKSEMQSLTGTKEKILDVAVDLISRHGYNGVSVRQIAHGVGIKESSIYNHFKNKEDILNCIFDCFHEGMQAKRPDTKDLAYELEFMDPKEIFKLLFIQYVKNRDSRIDKAATIIWMEQHINQRARNFIRRFMLKEPTDYYESILRAMAENGKIHDGADLRIAAEELNYGALGIFLELSVIVGECGDAGAMIQKLSDHVDFVFERLEKPDKSIPTRR
jgi:AcrR family transcriptional regulator